MSTIVAPSILAADFANLADSLQIIDNSAAEWVHIDVMDGVFVPNISFGFPIISAIRPLTKKVFDVHLMIQNADAYISQFRDAGADRITIHYEAAPHLDRTLSAIRQAGMKNGVALNPHTPVSLVQHMLPYIDMVLVMSVNPGYGGQKFIGYTVDKVAELKAEITRQGLSTLIEVDGGVNESTGQQLVNAGADALVAGSYVFKHENPDQAITRLYSLAPQQGKVVV